MPLLQAIRLLLARHTASFDRLLVLTEACFQQQPLEFDRTKQALLFNNGTRYPLKGIYVDEGTWPANSTWARNPVPRQGEFSAVSTHATCHCLEGFSQRRWRVRVLYSVYVSVRVWARVQTFPYVNISM